ncbi:tRNA (guanosine(37)-N1)-methyltransferase TrmD [candidate division WWE3 bacterium RIFCSPHIGHO2_01_FULL_40_23]|uniref:tRNA (guanine-N(1)-)-methyltransferase n=1 Tax=candidate division WWE3 bacterium RIFCSPLOWO2_01_FULL_41_18 TaxID=1802625 RepID=A0A1F4VE65_UNCKA|nr:MAG: tRNA (guanosine(37)-N1)-methyltransferase TrmD [candidate division WWE3 bacterium RIFCSPHIGHO2_01_FULL_40_23]OGC55230.1 MAG: tRNA (guanosine(37)-N1)-methyltransferase TrmD [candidate division WWE3 bacterium RIFCSPLOWO2_01_FULL_41_18]
MNFHIITLFPEMFEGVFERSLIKRAREKGIININLIQLRDFAIDRHGTVDDKPYGGGVGMLLIAKPIFDAVRSVYPSAGNPSEKSTNKRVILLSPRGEKLSQEKVKKLSKLSEIILICGRYEGVDDRVHSLCDEEISIGDYVLSGGEIPAMVLVDSVSRLIKGVLIKEEALKTESFTNGVIEFPQYTRPENFEGMKVPEILLSGDHKKIEDWKKEQARKLTKDKRPDLL